LSETNSKSKKNSAHESEGRAFLKHQPVVLPGWKIQLIFWLLVVLGLAMDLGTKAVVFSWLAREPGNHFSIIAGFLRLVRTENPGAAFGIATGQYHILVAVSTIALVVILAAFYFGGQQRAIVHVALALFAAGVCGNLWDRIFNNGYVRDFIDVYYRNYHWPAFNMADSMLCIGVGLLIISTFLTGRSCQKHARRQK
jgi:signal peptidase II